MQSRGVHLARAERNAGSRATEGPLQVNCSLEAQFFRAKERRGLDTNYKGQIIHQSALLKARGNADAVWTLGRRTPSSVT